MKTATLNEGRTTAQTRGYGVARWCGRAWRRLGAAEVSLARRVQEHVPGGYMLTRVLLFLAKLAVLGALLAVSIWLLLSVLVVVLFAFAVMGRASGDQNEGGTVVGIPGGSNGTPGPYDYNHATYHEHAGYNPAYRSLYDESGR